MISKNEPTKAEGTPHTTPQKVLVVMRVFFGATGELSTGRTAPLMEALLAIKNETIAICGNSGSFKDKFTSVRAQKFAEMPTYTYNFNAQGEKSSLMSIGAPTSTRRAPDTTHPKTH